MDDSRITDPTAELLRDHARTLRRLASSLLDDGHAADDLAQDAALLTLRSPPQHPAAAAGWFRTVLGRLAIRQRRARQRREGHERRALRDTDLPGPAEHAERQQLQRHLARALDALSEEQRTVIHWHYYDELSLRAIASRVGAPLATIRSRHQRALQRMRESLRASYGGEQRRVRSALLGSAMLPRRSAMPFGVAAAGGAALAAVLIASFGGPFGTGAGAQPSRVETVAASNHVRDSVVQDSDRGARTADRSVRERLRRVAPGPAPRISGRVVDRTGRGVEAAWIMGGVEPRRLRRVGESAADGSFMLDSSERPRFLVALASGYAPSNVQRVPASMTGSVESSAPSLELEVHDGGILVEGEVLSESGDEPVAGASVWIGRRDVDPVPTAMQPAGWSVGGFVVESDPAGHFELPAFHAGWLVGAATADGFAPRTAFQSAASGERAWLRLRLRGGVAVSGTVRDERGETVAGADVRVGASGAFAGRSTRSAADGSFTLTNVQPAGAKIVAVGPHGRRDELRFRAPSGSSTARWDPVLLAGTVLEGRVLAEGGDPLSGYRVELVAGDWPGRRLGTITGEDGRFAIMQCPSKGTLHVEVSRPGESDLPLHVLPKLRAPWDGPLEIEVPMARLAAGGALGGRLLDHRGRSANVRAAWLRAARPKNWPRYAAARAVVDVTAGTGAFEVQDLPCTSLELLVVTETGLLHAFQVPTPRSEERIDCGKLRLPRPGLLRATTMESVASVTARTRFLLERLDLPQRILEGRGAPPDALELAPGDYRLEVEVEPGPMREHRFTVQSGEVESVDFDLTDRIELRVVLVPKPGAQPDHAWLEVRDSETGALAVRRSLQIAGAGGLEESIALPPADYVVLAVAADGARAERPFRVGPGSTAKPLRLELK